MRLTINTNGNYTTRQLKLPLEIEKLIDIADPVYTFCEVMDHIDLSGYFVEKDYKTGRPRCDEQKLLKVILFAFMEHGISSLREIEKLCRTDIRYMYLLDDMKTPSFASFGNLIRNELTTSIEEIYECEDCSGCLHRSECCKKSVGNRTARLNRELTSFHQEVIDNLESIHGALLCMNRSIQSEGTFGIIKWDRSYKRLFRRGEKSVILEFTLISCGFNLYKYHNKKKRLQKAA